MSVFETKRELFEVRFNQALKGLQRLSSNRIVPLRWAVYTETQHWPAPPTVEQIQKEAQLTINADPAVWSEHLAEEDRPKPKTKLSTIEQARIDDEAAIRKRLPNLRKSTMDTATRVRVIHYLGKETFNNLPD